MKTYLMITVVVISALCGCKSPEQTAYKTLASIALSVQTAKHAYEDYRSVKGMVTPEQDIQVKRVYIQYQAAMKVAETYEKEIKKTGDKFSFNTALAATSSAANDFIGFVGTIVPTFKPTLIK